VTYTDVDFRGIEQALWYFKEDLPAIIQVMSNPGVRAKMEATGKGIPDVMDALRRLTIQKGNDADIKLLNLMLVSMISYREVALTCEYEQAKLLGFHEISDQQQYFSLEEIKEARAALQVRDLFLLKKQRILELRELLVPFSNTTELEGAF